MCTVIDNITRKTAQEDIEVYKVVVIVNMFGHSQTVAPYRYTVYESNDVHSELEVPTPHVVPIGCSGEIQTHKIEIGLHSIKNLDDAKSMFSWRFSNRESSCYKLIKATIPKGSEYYEGFDFISPFGDYVWPLLVSDRLILHPDEVIESSRK
jgi:hypothetical protein